MRRHATLKNAWATETYVMSACYATTLLACLLLNSLGLADEGAADRIAKGKEAMQASKYAEAVDFFSQAIRLEPRNAGAYLLRGEAYEADSKREMAIADYTQAIALEPKSPDAYCARGKAHYS